MVKISSMIRLPAMLKVPEFLLGLTVMLLARCGNQETTTDSYYLGWVDAKNVTQEIMSNIPTPVAVQAFAGTALSLNWADIIRLDAQNFCAMTGYGFLFIQLVMLVTVIAGERAPVQNIVLCLCGFIFYVALGSVRIQYTVEDSDNEATKLALGSMAIVLGVVYLVDTIFGVLDLKNND